MGQHEASAMCGRQEASGNLTRRSKGPFAVSWPRRLGEENVITITPEMIKFRQCFTNLVQPSMSSKSVLPYLKSNHSA